MVRDDDDAADTEPVDQLVGSQRQEHPERIGPYRILQILGEGGMGVVYEAEQTVPMTRRVALKVIKLGMDTKQVVARFEAERQALAVMDHPGIAKVYDAGATEDGRPFVAMERVRGVPITEYCDNNKLSTKERMRLFIGLCHAIQHAHQKGVIHRDLKPSNILVTVQDGGPVPKVIDFGIAKAVGRRLSDQTLVTEFGQAMGTPAYMSPEQAEMSGLDVDTRTDIYSLGVILYELLVGTVPIDPTTVGLPGFIAQLVLRETNPKTPSARLSSLGKDSEYVATLRSTDPSTLRRQIHGDLDWITMKALEHDRTRRYETPNALAIDLERHLSDEPVLARPPSVGYRVQKFVRRNRAVVGLGSGLVLTLLASAILTGVQAGRIAQERDRAEQEALTAQQVSDFLKGLFVVSDPSEARRDSTTAREILDRGAERIQQELADQPVVQGRLLTVMGAVYSRMGLYGEAERLLNEGLKVRRQALGDADAEVAESAQDLAWLLISQQRLDEALPFVEEAIAIRRDALGPDDPLYAWSLQLLGMVQRDQGDFDGARQTLQETLDIRRRVLDPGHVDIGTSLYHLGWLSYLEGEYHEARRIYEEALPILEGALGADHMRVAWCLSDLANVLSELREFKEAIGLLERALAILEDVYDDDHPYIASILNNLGSVQWEAGDLVGAKMNHERALRIRENVFGPGHSSVAQSLRNLGRVLQSSRDFVGALVHYSRALRIEETAHGSESLGVAYTLDNIGGLLRQLGDFEKALPILERSLRITESAMGYEHVDLQSPLVNLAFLKRDTGQLEEAAQYFERAIEIQERILGSDGPELTPLTIGFAETLSRMGDNDQALLHLERVKTICEEQSDPERIQLVDVYFELAKVHREKGSSQTADSLFQRALAVSRDTEGADSQTHSLIQARFWAVNADQVRALRFLTRATELGYDDPNLLRMPEFTSLHGLPEYEAIADKIRERLAPALRMDLPGLSL
jgi:serine/threonine protein kinase/tetratricopeptide (TPR) repeat protein